MSDMPLIRVPDPSERPLKPLKALADSVLLQRVLDGLVGLPCKS
jgi:hypothetical protein